ncbi:MAG TPA: alpha/beta fold hydrolase [Thermomicrobiales bacterium]|nr:alpha/beta fold hydrolase [Thermomicrobiales bacterium]
MSLQLLAVDQRSRRALLGATLAGIGAVAAGRFSANAANQSPEAGTATLDALAQTPLGEQLAWFLAAVNDGGASLTEADVTAHVAPDFLAVVPPAQIIGFIQGMAAGYGALTLQGVTRPPTENQAVALVSTAVGLQLALPITIEAADPYRITGLTIYPSPPADGKPLAPWTSDSTTVIPSWPLVDVGGRGIYRVDEGGDGPTVVCEAGLGDSDATWSGVIPAVADFASVVSYDRPNTAAGASDPAPVPRTAEDVVADLHALLETTPELGPYVLVGHSVGGLFARLYASQYPDEVAGLVLVDASHELQDQRRQELVSPELFAAEQQAVHSNSEGIDLDASFAQMSAARTATPLQPMPLVVLSAGQPDPATFPEGWPMDVEATLHAELQEDLAGLVPDGRYVLATESGHYIQQTQPDLVLGAIRDVVMAVRDPGSWGTSTS